MTSHCVFGKASCDPHVTCSCSPHVIGTAILQLFNIAQAEASQESGPPRLPLFHRAAPQQPGDRPGGELDPGGAWWGLGVVS